MKKLTPVSDLLAGGAGRLGALRAGAAQAERSLGVVRRHLPPELASQVFGAVLQEGVLTLLVRSGAWGTRIRYLIPDIQPALAADLGVDIGKVAVKVRSGRA